MTTLKDLHEAVLRQERAGREAAYAKDAVGRIRTTLIMAVGCIATGCGARPGEPCTFRPRPGRTRGVSGGDRYFHGHRVKAAGVDPKTGEPAGV